MRLEGRDAHVVVGLLQREVEVARHLVDLHEALEMASLAHVLAQLGDGFLILEDAGEELREQLAQQRVAAPEGRAAQRAALQQLLLTATVGGGGGG